MIWRCVVLNPRCCFVLTICALVLQKYKKEATAPLLINSCEVDAQFPIESQKVADEVLGNGQFAPGYERTYWEGCHHGFAVRGDLVRNFFCR